MKSAFILFFVTFSFLASGACSLPPLKWVPPFSMIAEQDRMMEKMFRDRAQAVRHQAQLAIEGSEYHIRGVLPEAKLSRDDAGQLRIEGYGYFPWDPSTDEWVRRHVDFDRPSENQRRHKAQVVLLEKPGSESGKRDFHLIPKSTKILTWNFEDQKLELSDQPDRLLLVRYLDQWTRIKTTPPSFSHTPEQDIRFR